MSTTRIEAFSDAVLAIVITIMVLELKPPEGETLADLWSTSGVGLLGYAVSFVYVGIYWNNHHHLFQVVDEVDGTTLWANLLLMFWISLFPFTTGWVDESGLAPVPLLAYGVVLLAAACSYYLLQLVLLRRNANSDAARRAWEAGRTGVLGASSKEKVSIGLYVLGVLLAAGHGLWGDRVASGGAIVCYVLVAVLWFVPDRRIERARG
ncbi:TMEM175 family protein [Kocuria sp.]|uniref:TMEM175 family protein n=1 Tax=Kocuria sp. TaxID=1871328 RepID=UPI0026DD876B|nr:TMEM175 family protein [Kocuria sp.]MDO4918986.1 TMEM175 family protein [Kocuria sp.]